jgi:hypothetical protein
MSSKDQFIVKSALVSVSLMALVSSGTGCLAQPRSSEAKSVSQQTVSALVKDAGAGNGGDLARARKAKIRKWIPKLRYELLKFVSLAKDSDLSSQFAARLNQMKRLGLAQDIWNSISANVVDSALVGSGACIDEVTGAKRAATSKNGDLNSLICYDVELLDQQGATLPTLLALKLHEHGHRLNFDDSSDEFDNDFTAEIAEVYERVIAPQNYSLRAPGEVCISASTTRSIHFEVTSPDWVRCSVSYGGRTVAKDFDSYVWKVDEKPGQRGEVLAFACAAYSSMNVTVRDDAGILLVSSNGYPDGPADAERDRLRNPGHVGYFIVRKECR